MKRSADVPFYAQPATINASVNVLYCTPLDGMTEEQRSDLCNAAGIYLQRLREYRSAKRKAKDGAAHASESSGGDGAPAKAPEKAREKEAPPKRGKKRRR